MALSGSAYTAFARHRLVIEWSASQSIPNNNSTVTAKVYLQSMDGYGAMYASAMNNGSITVNGQTQTFTANSDLRAYQKKLLATRTFTVGHNADGSKSFNFSATYYVNVTFSGVFYGNRTASGSATLNTIPRASGVSLSNANINLGASTNINISRASGSFRHTLIYKIGSYSKTIATKTGSTTVSYTPEIGIASQFPSATSGRGTITCETYNGNTRIGTRSVKLTVNTVNNATFQPSISSVVLSETVAEITSKFGAVYLQGKSRIRAVTSCSQKYGAGIKSIVTTVGGTSMSGQNVISGAINTSGTLTASTVLTDTRGYTATYNQTVKIEPYQNPRIEIFNVERRSTAQEILDMNWKAYTSNVVSKNVMGYRLKWKQITASSWTTIASSSNATTTTWADSKVQAGADVGKTYDVLLEVFDSLMTVTSQYQIATATVPMSWGRTGTAIGKVYEESMGGALQVRGMTDLEGDVRLGHSGRLYLSKNMFADNGGGMHFNNSDVVGVNAIYVGAFQGVADPADNNGEGLLFPKPGLVLPESGVADWRNGWDNFRIHETIGYLNGNPIFTEDTALWQGGLQMTNNHTITPSIPIAKCPHGWLFLWSWFSDGTAKDHNFMITFSHKRQALFSGGSNHIVGAEAWVNRKYLYINPTTVVGHVSNTESPRDRVVLRGVYAY